MLAVTKIFKLHSLYLDSCRQRDLLFLFGHDDVTSLTITLTSIITGGTISSSTIGLELIVRVDFWWNDLDNFDGELITWRCATISVSEEKGRGGKRKEEKGYRVKLTFI